MIKKALNILKTRPANAVELFDKKYRKLFTDTKLLSEVLKLEWNEENHKQLSFFAHKVIWQARVQGRLLFREFLPAYDRFESYMLGWFFHKFENLHFKVWGHWGKEGLDLLKILFKENKLDGYEKDSRYKKLYKQCESQLKEVLKNEKVLSLLLNTKGSWNQYKLLMSFSYMLREKHWYFNHPLPVYVHLQKYMYHWNRFYFRAIPFENWEDLAKEGLDLLKTLLKKNKLHVFKKDPHYIKFLHKLEPRLRKLSIIDHSQINKMSKNKRRQLKEIVDVLKLPSDEASYFFSLQERDFLIRFKNGEIISKLLEEKWSKKKYVICVRFAFNILCQLGERSFGYEASLEVPPVYEHFQKYMYNCTLLENKPVVPFKEWEDLAKEKIDVLKILFEQNKLRHFKRCKIHDSFSAKYFQRIQDLLEKGYDELDYWEGI